MPSGHRFDARAAVKRTRAASTWPARTANKNGVNAPVFERALMSAPASMSTWRRCVFRRRPHQRRLFPASVAFTFAPCASRILTAADRAVRAPSSARSPLPSSPYSHRRADSSFSIIGALLFVSNLSAVMPHGRGLHVRARRITGPPPERSPAAQCNGVAADWTGARGRGWTVGVRFSRLAPGLKAILHARCECEPQSTHRTKTQALQQIDLPLLSPSLSTDPDCRAWSTDGHRRPERIRQMTATLLADHKSGRSMCGIRIAEPGAAETRARRLPSLLWRRFQLPQE